MPSDLKNLLRFTPLQTRMLIGVSVGFFIIIGFFLFLYTRTETNIRASVAERDYDDRMLRLDTMLQDYSNQVIRMKNMAMIDMDESIDKPSTNVDATRICPGLYLPPESRPGERYEPEFQREINMASRLSVMQQALINVGRPVARAYYYSNQYRFLVSMPSGGPDSLRTALDSRLVPNGQDNQERPFWVGPYVDEALNTRQMTLAIRLYRGDQFMGVLGLDIPLTVFSGFTESFFEGKGQAFLFSENGTLLAAPRMTDHDHGAVISSIGGPARPGEHDDLSGQPHAGGEARGFKQRNGYFVLDQDSGASPVRLVFAVRVRSFVDYMISSMRVFLMTILTIVILFSLGVYIMTTRFIKPTRIAEIALQKAHDQLELRVHERTMELSRINEELKESREKYRQLFTYAPAGIYEIDFISGKFLSVNDVLCEYTGYSKEEFLKLDPFALVTKHGQMILKERLKSVLRGESISRNVEVEIVTKKGDLLSVVLNNSFVFSRDRITGSRVVIHDITEKKKHEAEKHELQKTLDRARKMEALGLLAGGVAHDLNNILSGIINYPELILMDLPLDSPIRGHVKAIYRSGKKAAAIVDDLITVARGAARKQEIVNVNSIVDDYLQSAEYASMVKQYPQVGIHVALDTELHAVSTSSVQVRKALLNLVINAVESVEGQGSVHISSRNVTLGSPIKGYDEIPPGDYVLLSVADTGSGITPDDMERIFEPFYSKKVMGRSGTGLGLSIVWNTVTEHGGHINVTSGTGGTVFDLYFPATRLCFSEKKESRTIDHVKGRGETVLVVDDESIQREIAAQLLESLRYATVVMESGEKAVEYLKHERVDVILLDMVMEPGMNGRETYEKIIELNPAQKVVITTGYADTQEVKMAQEKGAGELLKKPYTLEELGLVINRQLR